MAGTVLSKYGSDAQARLRSSVGFLTSGTEVGRPSTILVSREEHLVYPLDEEQKERGPDGLALGYRQDIPAFVGEFLWLWTYVLTVGMRIKISDLPGLMNDPTAPLRWSTIKSAHGPSPSPEPTSPSSPPRAPSLSTVVQPLHWPLPPCQWTEEAPDWATVAALGAAEGERIPALGVDGFVAAFVGDEASFGALLLESFLPLGPIDPATGVPIPRNGGPGTFEEIVPVGPFGLFAEDRQRVSPDSGDQSGDSFSFLEIATVDGVIQVVEPEPGTRPGQLEAWLDPLWREAHPGERRHPIVRYLFAHVAMNADGSMVAADHVPYGLFLSEIFKRATAKEWKLRAGPCGGGGFAGDMEAYFEDLNGRLPLGYCDALYSLTLYAASYGLEEVQRLVREAYDFVLWKVRNEPPHSDTAAGQESWPFLTAHGTDDISLVAILAKRKFGGRPRQEADIAPHPSEEPDIAPRHSEGPEVYRDQSEESPN
jgi:hypothetical protein